MKTLLNAEVERNGSSANAGRRSCNMEFAMTKTKKKTTVKKKAAARAGGYATKKKLALVVDNYPVGSRAETVEPVSISTPGLDAPFESEPMMSTGDYTLLAILLIVGFAIGYFLFI